MSDPTDLRSGIAKPTAEEEAELRAMLKPRRIQRWDRSLSRYPVFTEKDERVFVRLLREAFPDFLVVGEIKIDGKDRWHCSRDFFEFRHTRYVVLPELDWSADTCIDPDGREVFRWPSIGFRYYGARFFPWPHGEGNFPSGSWRPAYFVGTYAFHETAQQRFIRKVCRLSDKITTNKVKIVDRDTGEVAFPRETGARCGFDALRWCAEDPMRVLDQNCRPTDDWTMPDSPYYD